MAAPPAFVTDFVRSSPLVIPTPGCADAMATARKRLQTESLVLIVDSGLRFSDRMRVSPCHARRSERRTPSRLVHRLASVPICVHLRLKIKQPLSSILHRRSPHLPHSSNTIGPTTAVSVRSLSTFGASPGARHNTYINSTFIQLARGFIQIMFITISSRSPLNLTHTSNCHAHNLLDQKNCRCSNCRGSHVARLYQRSSRQLFHRRSE